MEQLFYRYNPWWEDSFDLQGVFHRKPLIEKLYSLVNTKDIVIITGLRRIGKTTAMKLLIDHLLNEKEIGADKIFYISLDDYLLANTSIIEIVGEYRKIHKLKFEEKVFLFLDEITYKKDYEQQLKNLYDSQNVKIFASLSQSSVLKSRKSLITGRARIIEVLPLDFEEYLQFKKIKLTKKDSHLTERFFEDFLFTGGIPEYVLRGDIEYLKEVVDDIILKDVAAQHNIKDIMLLKDFFLLLMERCGKVFSINKMANILKVSPDTIKRYMDYFQQSYLIYLLPRYGKTNERLLSAKKIYSADIGIRNIFTGFRDKGRLFENYVYLKLKNRNPSYIYKDGNEIGFITEDKILLEVKYGGELKNKQFELFKSIKAKEKYLITSIYDLQESGL
jgi:uncharacterized protein